LAGFITAFETTQKEIQRKKEKEAKDAARKNNPISPKAKPAAGAGPGGAPVMGDVMNQMKTGSFFRYKFTTLLIVSLDR